MALVGQALVGAPGPLWAPHGSFVGPPWALVALVGSPGALVGHPWVLAGPLRAPVGPSWAPLGFLWAPLGSLWAPPWALMGSLWVLVGPLGSYGLPWALGSPPGPNWGQPKVSGGGGIAPQGKEATHRAQGPGSPSYIRYIHIDIQININAHMNINHNITIHICIVFHRFSPLR